MHAGAQAVAADEALHGEALLSKAASLLRTAETILGAAITGRDPATALKAIREAGRMVELCAKLTGDLDESTTVKFRTIAYDSPPYKPDARPGSPA